MRKEKVTVIVNDFPYWYLTHRKLYSFLFVVVVVVDSPCIRLKWDY